MMHGFRPTESLVLLLCFALTAAAAPAYRVVVVNPSTQAVSREPVTVSLPAAVLDQAAGVEVRGTNGSIPAQFAWDLDANGSIAPTGVLWLADVPACASVEFTLTLLPGTPPEPVEAPDEVRAGPLAVRVGRGSAFIYQAALTDAEGREWPFFDHVSSHGPGGDLAAFNRYEGTYRVIPGPVATTIFRGGRETDLDIAWMQRLRLWPERRQIGCTLLFRNLGNRPAALGQMHVFDCRPAPGGKLTSGRTAHGEDIAAYIPRGAFETVTEPTLPCRTSVPVVREWARQPLAPELPRMTMLWGDIPLVYWTDAAATGPNQQVGTWLDIPAPIQTILYNFGADTDRDLALNCRFLLLPAAGREYPVIAPGGELRATLWLGSALENIPPDPPLRPFPQPERLEIKLLPMPKGEAP